MPLYVYLGAVAVVASVPLLLWSIAGVRQSAPRAGARLRRPTDLREIRLATAGSERVVDPFIAGISRRARKMTPAGATETLERRIQQAGKQARWPIERVMATKLLAAALGAALGLMWFATSPSVLLTILWGGLVLLGWYAPDLILKGRAKDRMDRLEIEMPDVLDQLTVSVEAGLGFEAAMARVSDEGGTEMADEIGRVIQDVRVGVPRQAALDRLLERAPAPAVRHFVTAVGQAERLGVPIASVLRVMADELREKRKVDAEERAGKVPVKLVFPLVLCLLPALFVVILGPSVIRIIQSGLFS